MEKLFNLIFFRSANFCFKKFFWPTENKKYSSDLDKLLQILRSLEQFIQTVKGHKNI